MQVLAANILVRIPLPCLSNSLDKNTNILSMFVLFSLLFSPCWMFGCFRKWGNISQKQSNRMFSVNISKVQQLRNIFATNSGYFDYILRTNLTADTYVRHFKIKLYFCGKKIMALWTIFWGQRWVPWCLDDQNNNQNKSNCCECLLPSKVENIEKSCLSLKSVFFELVYWFDKHDTKNF